MLLNSVILYIGKKNYINHFPNDKNYQLQPQFQRQLKSYRLPLLPLFRQHEFLRDVVSGVSLRRPGTRHYQPLSHPAVKEQPD